MAHFKNMRQVSKDEFYSTIGPLDVELSSRSHYDSPDYGTDFRTKGFTRDLVGRTLCVGQEGSPWKPDIIYFLPIA